MNISVYNLSWWFNFIYKFTQRAYMTETTFVISNAVASKVTPCCLATGTSGVWVHLYSLLPFWPRETTLVTAYLFPGWQSPSKGGTTLNSTALWMAKTLWSFGRSECNRVKGKYLLLRKQILSFKVDSIEKECITTMAQLVLQMNLFTWNFRVNSIALRKAKIVCNFGLSECNRVKKNAKLRGYCNITVSFTNWGFK